MAPGRKVVATCFRSNTVSLVDVEKALALHHDAHKACFIANSVNFPVTCEAEVIQA